MFQTMIVQPAFLDTVLIQKMANSAEKLKRDSLRRKAKKDKKKAVSSLFISDENLCSQSVSPN